MRKVNILLNAFETAKKEVEYYALDLSLAELNRTFSEIDAASYNYVSLRALHGTYDDGLAWLEATKQKNKSTCVMTLGSSLGNFTRTEAADFLASFKQILQPSDYMLVGLDACQDTKRVFAAYNDAENVTERFYRNGLEHANKLLGYKAFRQEDWRIEGVYDSVENRHSASYVALKDVDTKDFSIKNGDKLHLEDAFKYSEEESDKLWYNAGLIPHRAFANTKEDYCMLNFNFRQIQITYNFQFFICYLHRTLNSLPQRSTMLLIQFQLSRIGRNYGLLGILSQNLWYRGTS